MNTCSRGHAPAHPPTSFTPEAIMARARAHAAEQAARAASVPDPDSRSPADALAALAARIDAQAPEPPRPAPGAPSADELLASIERAIGGANDREIPGSSAHLARAEGTAPTASAAKDLTPAARAESTALASTSPSRRLALFGGAAALLAPMAPRPAAARVAEADAELARIADEIDRALDGAAYAMEPADDEAEQDRRIGLAVERMDRMVALPSAGLAGVNAKAKAYLDLWSYDVDTADLSRSLAEDAERVSAEVLA